MDLWTAGCAGSRLTAPARSPLDKPWATRRVAHRLPTGRRLPTSPTALNPIDIKSGKVKTKSPAPALAYSSPVTVQTTGTTAPSGGAADTIKIVKAADKIEDAASVLAKVEKAADATKATPGTAIQSYWPPNGGFLGPKVPQTLQPGYSFSRFGGFIDESGAFKDFGNYVAPVDVPYGMRALPQGTDITKPLTVYEVLKPIPDVPTGRAAPAFNELGLGVQHQLPLTIQDYLDQGYIRIVKQTIPKN